MTSDTSQKVFMEHNLTSHFSRPKNKIKPLISISPFHQHLNEEKLKKKLALHSTTGKNFSYAPNPSSPFYRQSIKNSVELFRNQHHLSALSYHENKQTYFNHNLFFSNLKHLPALSSLTLKLTGDSHNTLKPLTPLLANLSSYKSLTHLEIQFVHFQTYDLKLLRLLFRGIQALKPTLKSLSFAVIQCRNMKDQDLRVISFYLRKFTQLEALELTFHNSASFDEPELSDVAVALCKLKSLRKLDLNFGGCSVVYTIPKFLAALQQLRNLSDLSLNFSKCDIFQEVNLTTESIAAGLMTIKTHPIQKLTLDLSTLYHSSEDLSLSRILPQFTLLKSLGLYFINYPSKRPLKDQDFIGVLACLKEILHLSSLTLSFYNLTRLLAIVGNVGRTLKFLPGLAQLKLDFSTLTCPDEEMTNLSSGLECLTSLKSLEISLEWIKFARMEGINTLTEAFKKMARLRNLTLNLNRNAFITNQGFSDLCSSISCLRDLTWLDLNLGLCMSWTPKDAEEFAKTLKHLDSLEILRFNCIELFKVGNRQEIFQILFEVIQKKKTIQDVILRLGEGLNPPETLWFKQTKNFSLY